jgi:glycerate 2-kinase
VNVLIAPDKFKGTLSGSEAAKRIRQGWRKARCDDMLRLLPICDGGDGFGETLAILEGAQKVVCRTIDAAQCPIRAQWWWQPEKRMAIIESSIVIGLAGLPKGKYHPFDLDTQGLGKVLKQAVSRGAQTCVIGIGGSATNDGGFGLARALGWGFMDTEGKEITSWTCLEQLASVKKPPKSRLFRKLIIASDVTNILLGAQGASRIFGPQKGLRAADMKKSENCLRILADQTDALLKKHYQYLPGAGAAGGLGYGLMAFLGGRVRSGFDFFARRAQLESQIRWADLVLTGEGSLDRSTLMGKGVGLLAQKCRNRQTPCIGLGGVASQKKQLNDLFQAVYTITPSLADSYEAQRDASKWLRLLAQRVASEIPW